MRRALLALALIAAGSGPALAQGSSARYRLRFEALWSAQSHPGAYHGAAHFSPLTGGSHAVGTHFWEEGALATNGIEQMAETGATNFLRSEVLDAVANGTAGGVFAGGGAVSPGMTETNIVVSEEFPLATVVTMIAPSPDWFIGTDGLELFVGGRWLDEVVVELPAWDAGTDDGTDFGSPNDNTNPAQPIARITTGPLAGTPPMGRFTFTRIASTWVFGCGTNPEGTLFVSGLPRLGDTVSFALDDPNDVLNTPAVSSLSLATSPDPSFPCGRIVPGFGLGGPGQGVEVLLRGATRRVFGPISSGESVTINVPIPNRPALVGRTYYAQGALVDSGGRTGLTEAVELLIGL